MQFIKWKKQADNTEDVSIIWNNAYKAYEVIGGETIGSIFFENHEQIKDLLKNGFSTEVLAELKLNGLDKDKIYINRYSIAGSGEAYSHGNFYGTRLEYYNQKNELPYGVFNMRYGPNRETLFKPYTKNNDKVALIKNKNLKELVLDFFNNKVETGRKDKLGMLLYGPPGCHAKGEKILMFDGSFKNVEDVVIGDELMGPDSQPREVLKLVRGRDKMVKINPTKGESFVVNYNHILHLTPSGETPFNTPINISVKNLLECTTKPTQERFKLTRSSGIEFSKKETFIEPYLFGFWLGDGNSDSFAFHTADNEIKEYIHNFCQKNDAEYIERVEENNLSKLTIKKRDGRTNPFIQELKSLEVFNNKHIPKIYLNNSRENRLELLAGLLDSDGHLKWSNGFEFVSMYETLANQVVYLSRSLGFAAYVTKEHKICQTGNGEDYYRVSISGDTNLIPTKIARKKGPVRNQIKSVLRTGFTVEILPEDDFYGFTVDSDHLYLDSHFNIQHNCGKTTEVMELFDICQENKMRIFIIDSGFNLGNFQDLRHLLSADNCVFVLEEVTERLNKGVEEILTFLDGENSWTNSITIATTNYPEDMPANLIDRPGRFEVFIEYNNPKKEEIIELGKAFGFPEEESSCLAGQGLSFDYVSFILSKAKKLNKSVKETRTEEEEKRKRLSATFKGKMGI